MIAKDGFISFDILARVSNVNILDKLAQINVYVKDKGNLNSCTVIAFEELFPIVVNLKTKDWVYIRGTIRESDKREHNTMLIAKSIIAIPVTISVPNPQKLDTATLMHNVVTPRGKYQMFSEG